MVAWELAHRSLDGIETIGIDEIHMGQGKKSNNFLTVIYQIDAFCRRLLWVGRTRKVSALRKGLASLGQPVLDGIRHVCTDMWRPYLKVVGAMLGHACHMIDRFHVTQHLNGAVDEVRRSRIAPMIKVANMLEKHEELLLNWIRARRDVFAGATAGIIDIQQDTMGESGRKKGPPGSRRIWACTTPPVPMSNGYRCSRAC